MLSEIRDRVVVFYFVAATAALMACPGPPVRADDATPLSDLAQRIKRDTEWIAGVTDRSVGSKGHAAVQSKLLERVQSIPNITVRTQEFEVSMPVTEKAELTVLDGKWKGKYPVYPVWPAVVRLNATPRKGFSGRAVYTGGVEHKSLPARSLRGQVAVMDITVGGGWRRAFAFGARAVLLLGMESETHHHFHSHILPEPVYFPRFYLPEGELAQAFRDGEVGNIRLSVRSSWQWKTATNIYALVKARGGPPGERALVIGAGYDAVSMVQGMAYGADAAVDAALVLNLLEHFAANPTRRPLFFVLADAQGINQLGVRRMLEAYSARTQDRKRPESADRKRVKKYQEHLALVDELGQDPSALAKVYESEYKPLHRYVKDVLAGELNDLGEDIPDLRIEIDEAEEAEKPEMKAQLETMVARQNQLRGLQNQILFKTEIADKNRGEAARVWRTVYSRVHRQMEDVNEPILRWQRFDRMREELASELGVTDEDRQPLLFLLGVDLSDAGYSCGPAMYCAHLKHTVSAADLVRWLIRVRDDEATPVWTKDQLRFVNLVPLRPQASASTYTVGHTPTFSSPAESYGLKSGAWQTLEGYRRRCDTSYDRFEFLDWGRLGPQIDATKALVDAMSDPSVFKVRLKKVSRLWKRVTGGIVDRSPGDPVPKVPMVDYMVALGRGAGQHARTIGIRMNEFATTGIDGRFRFDGLPTRTHRSLTGLAVMAFKFDSEGNITRTVSKVEKASGLKQRANLGGAEEELRAMVFDCVEVAYPPSFMDVRALAALQKPQILDAVRRRSPEFHNITMAAGHLCAFVPPDTKWQILARFGDADPKMLVLNAVDPDTAESEDIREDTLGFEPREPLPTIVELISARDLWRVNERRLRGFRRAGISSKVIENIHARTKGLLEEAEQAEADDDGAALYNAATGALANEMRAYRGVRQTANDIVRAVMILLLGLLPFSIAMERLLFASSHIYKQIVLTALVFVVMCIALWSFHPAFRITSQPLMLILAFLIIFLSTMVIGILIRRFESDLERMRSGRAEESGAGTARGGLISCALTIGIATMRKRKLRTALTGMTVALITFALLSFSSATTVKEFNEFELSSDPAPPGIFVTTPNKRDMSGAAYGIIKNMAGTNSICYPRYWWATALHDQKWRLHVVQPETGSEAMLKGGFVLDPADAEISGIDKMLPDWETFQRERGCYLAPETAAALGLEPGDEILAGGYPLKFVGTFEPTVFSEKMRTLTGDPYLPVDYTAIDPDEKQAMAETKLEDIADTIVDDSHLLKNLDWLEPRDMIVIPRTNGVGGLSMHSVYLKPEGTNSIRDMAVELTQRLDYPVYYSTGKGGVKVLTAAALIPKAPRSVVIPLLLAGLIIFNTMLNSIAERKKEIHVYTSLGLAPAHVAGIFIAEAATYGLMGSTFGYIIGQGMATVFSKLGWMGNITLNYSGTQVMWTMTLVLLVVILAALVPAMMAARLASPSKETGWHLPEPDGDTIRDMLPFTVTMGAAPGVQAFLYEYLDAHREGSIGYFSSDNIKYLPAEEGRHAGGVEATVWLAPYDLGVRQDVKITLAPSEDDVCDLGLELTRKSGQPKDWRKLNKVFVASLRNQMLGWRNISVERVLGYINAAEAAGSA